MIPKGFLFSVENASIKKSGSMDIALIFSEREANIAGTFTKNRIKAAPVKLNQRKVRSGKGQAIFINSGNANACTGIKGMQDSIEIVNLIADSLKIKTDFVYVCSTGVIGKPLPMERIRKKVPMLIGNLGRSTVNDVAEAIMTTDTFPKVVTKKVKIGSKTGIITGICKGAGMICPDMATMLCFVITDIAVDQKALDKALHEAIENSFNRITVDGDMSTNDTALIMANGMLENTSITIKSDSYNIFKKVLNSVTYELARLIVKDGEGATRLIEIVVKGAKSLSDARKIAFSVANSNLFKTAIYGSKVNWGRIMAAIGYSGVELREEKTDIYIGNIKVVNKGVSTGRESKASRILKKKDINIAIDLNYGNSFVRVLTCDLTEDYIRINASYRT